MGIFDKLFGTKKKNTDKTLSESEILNRNIKDTFGVDYTTFENKIIDATKSIFEPNESTEKSESTYDKVFNFNGSQITITKFNKLIKKDKSNGNLEEMTNLFESFYKVNENKFSFEDSYRLVNNFFHILSSRKSNEEVKSYIHSKLSKYVEFDSIEFLVKRAKMYNAISTEEAISFLKAKNNLDEINILSHSEEVGFIESVNYETELLIKLKKYNDARLAYPKVSRILPFLPEFEYLKYTRICTDFQATLCLEQTNPDHISYLNFHISSFLMDILNDISGFPLIQGFFYRKSNKFISLSIDESLEELGMTNSKDDLINEILEFAYNTLPLLYGIPKEYLIEEYIKNLNKTNSEEYSKLFRDFDMKDRKKECQDTIFGIYDFVGKVILKYYNKNIQENEKK